VDEKKSDWHLKETSEVLRALGSRDEGLSDSEAAFRLSQYGFNEIAGGKRESPLRMFLKQFANFLVIILIVAAIVSGVIGEWVEAAAIVAIVILAAVLGFVQEFRAEKALEALQRLAAPTASVIRSGREREIPAREIVPGDIVILRTGDRVPADLRLMEAVNLQTNESSLTGESLPVEKIAAALSGGGASLGDRKNMAFMGTIVVYGRGKGVAAATGMATEFGQIARMMEQAVPRKTPLQISLDKTGRWLGVFSLILCAAIAATGVSKGYEAVDMLIWGAALAVAVIPEALPAVVTISLALGVRRMVKRHALIRNLPAVETLGCTSVICSDKTGTLTRDEMTVRRIWVNGELVEVSGIGYVPEGEFSRGGRKMDPAEPHLALLLRIGALCNDTRLISEKGAWLVQGDSTEGALVVAAAKAGLDGKKLSIEYPRTGEIPFSSERKRMTTIHTGPSGRIAYSKGAAEVILEACNRIYRPGREEPLTPEARAEILNVARDMADQALRVLGLAYKPLGESEAGEHAERDMIFVGLVGMIDPPREEVKAAIKVCEEAGIKTVMITGDYKATAMAVARELGLLDGSMALSGAELDRLSDEEFDRIVERVNVYARVSPAHKMRVIDAFAKKGYVVAMTGDGVNDAPALKKADIGIAMGITGTDVSKEAADMVLTDDNFASIVSAVEEGRTIFANIRKYLVYLLSGNAGAVIAMVAALFWGLPLPLGAVQILFINLLMDGAPAIALGVEPPEPGIMKRPPRDPRATVFDRRALIYIAGIGLWIGLAALLIFKWYEGREVYGEGESPEKAMTMFFAALIAMRLVNAFNCRSPNVSFFRLGPFTNKWLTLACIGAFGLMLAAIYVPFLETAFDTEPLSLEDWGVVFGAAASVLFVVEAAKLLFRVRTRKRSL